MSESKASYTVAYAPSYRFTQQVWVGIEKGQHSEHTREVNRALLACLAELGQSTATLGGVKVLGDAGEALYARLADRLPFPRAGTARLVGKKKAPAPSKAMMLRVKNSEEKIDAIGREFAAALAQSQARSPSDAALLRLLHHDLYEVRGLVLMCFARRLSAAVSGSGTATAGPPRVTDANRAAAHELDVAIQKFRAPLTGSSYLDPTRSASPAEAMEADLTAAVANLRAWNPFDGVRLAVHMPSVLWRTRYDGCLVRPPVRARESQRATMRVLQEFGQSGEPFLVLNRAPPGAGKSALLVPIAAYVISRGEELYVCAGQGCMGVLQFMQVIYGASIVFANVFMERGQVAIVRQHSNKDAKCSVFIGTADGIGHLLATQSPAAPRIGWLVIDEPTYGADLTGSPACQDITRLLACLPPHNRRAILLGATLPKPAEIPRIIRFFGRHREIPGSLDSVQIACEVRDFAGRAVLPHSQICTVADATAVAAQVRAKPFLARMYTVPMLVMMRDVMARHGVAGLPDLAASFNRAENLRPEVVADLAASLLDAAATAPDAIAALAAAVPPSGPVFDPLLLATSAPPDAQTMVVDVDPVEFALRCCAPLLAALTKEVGSAADLYSVFQKGVDRAKATADAASTKSAKTARKQKSGDDDADARGESQRTGADSVPDAPVLGFPAWAQVGTAAHRARFGTAGVARSPAPPEGVPLCEVPDPVQLLLLAGVGILSDALPCLKYASEVWRRAGAGELSILFTDHSGCYGANLLLGAVAVTEAFAARASLATLEQAGGRLCRVGLTYRGVFILPTAAIDALLGNIRLGDAAPSSVEAANMETAFAHALVRLRTEGPAGPPLPVRPRPEREAKPERGAIAPRRK